MLLGGFIYCSSGICVSLGKQVQKSHQLLMTEKLLIWQGPIGRFLCKNERAPSIPLLYPPTLVQMLLLTLSLTLFVLS